MDDIRSLSSLSERSDSDQRVDVHVYIVPRELWQDHLCSAVNQVISDTVSAGFVRVLPETCIYNLRTELESQLDYDILPVNYVFLRCVGRCFTRLRPKQEHTLKVKHFIPPQTYAPELFVLESTGEVMSSTSQGSVDSHSRLTQYNIKSSGSSELSGHRRLPPINTVNNNNTVNHQTTQTGNEGWSLQQQPTESARTAGHVTAMSKLADSSDNQDFDLERTRWPNQSPDPGSNSNNKSTQFPDRATGVTGVTGPRPESLPMLIELSDSFDVGRTNNFNSQRQIPHTSRDINEQDRQRHENIIRQQKEEDMRKAEELERQRRLEEQEIETQHNTRRRQEDERNRQIAEEQRRKQQQQQQLEEEQERRREEERRKQQETQRLMEIQRQEEEAKRLEEKNKEQQREEERRQQELQAKRLDEEKRRNEEQKQRETEKRNQEEIQRKRDFEQRKLEKSASDKQQKEAEKAALLKELAELRASRQEKQRKRDELMKHAKQLHNKTRSGRNHSRDIWKKKYFEEKRKTSPLEEQARKLRHELELIHKRILSHMEKMKDGGTYSVTGGPSQQNNLRIQTVRLQQEIDVIQRRIGDINMKLTAEIKLRYQVEQELKALKSELSQQRTKIRALQLVEPADRHPYDHIHTHRSAATQEQPVG